MTFRAVMMGGGLLRRGYRREDRGNPEIIAFVDWIAGLMAQEAREGWR